MTGGSRCRRGSPSRREDEWLIGAKSNGSDLDQHPGRHLSHVLLVDECRHLSDSFLLRRGTSLGFTGAGLMEMMASGARGAAAVR